MSKPATIATWNVNSVRARLEHLLAWIDSGTAPDILLLQELKCESEAFPRMELEERGYNVAVHGQKSYNGVGILSKFPLEDVTPRLPGNDADDQARYIEALVSIGNEVLRVASAYVPNGNEIGSEKFAYKLAFFDRLHARMQDLLKLDEMLVLGADFNVAPFPIDVYDPKSLDGTVCYHPLEREKIRKLMNLGLYDSWRALHPDTQAFSWWDYRGNSWKADYGMRIDYLLLSPLAADRLLESDIVRVLREAERASDHAPVRCGLKIGHATGKLFAA